MTQDQLRKEYLRFSICNTLTDCYELLNIFSDFLFLLIKKHQPDEVQHKSLEHAKIVMQMMFTKVAHLKKVAEGITYDVDEGASLNQITDPTIVAGFIRNIYETVCMFHIVFVKPQANEEKTILYNLWVCAGLNYRQRFEANISTPENFKKVEDEKRYIHELEQEIQVSNTYKGLSQKDQKKIKAKLHDKDYKVMFENNEVKFLDWHKISSVMGINEQWFKNVYTHLSLYSHPSYVSVFQFADMYSKANPAFASLTVFNLNKASILISVFIADYIQVFPQIIDTYNNLTLRDQIIINLHNKLFRGDQFSINKSWEILG